MTTYDTAAPALALLGVNPPANRDGKPAASALAGTAYLDQWSTMVGCSSPAQN